SSSGSVVSSSEATGSDFLRSRISTTLTVIRCNQVEKADSPRKVPILRKSCRKASCIRSSASDGLFTMRCGRPDAGGFSAAFPQDWDLPWRVGFFDLVAPDDRQCGANAAAQEVAPGGLAGRNDGSRR